MLYLVYPYHIIVESFIFHIICTMYNNYQLYRRLFMRYLLYLHLAQAEK